MSAYDPLNRPNNSPYLQENYYNDSTGYIPQRPGYSKKKPVSNWIKFGVPILILVLAGGGVGAYFATRKKTTAASSSSPGSASGSAAASAKLALGRFATATNSEFMMPIYPATVSPDIELCLYARD